MTRQRIISLSGQVLPGDTVNVVPGSAGWVHLHLGGDVHLFGDRDAMAETLSDALTGVQSLMDNEEENG